MSGAYDASRPTIADKTLGDEEIMEGLSVDNLVGQLVKQAPARSRVFERYGIDYCCGGRRTLEQATRERGLDALAVLAELEDVGKPDSDVRDPAAMTMTELVDHIEETHHEYLKTELPRLRQLVAKVASKHGESFPWLNDVRSTFGELQAELEPHMQKEEQILFPMIRDMERVGGSAHGRPMVEGPISVMEHEHDNAARALQRLRNVTSGFVLPDKACASFRAMLNGLETLEQDLHQHIHKENNILFVRALGALEET